MGNGSGTLRLKCYTTSILRQARTNHRFSDEWPLASRYNLNYGSDAVSAAKEPRLSCFRGPNGQVAILNVHIVSTTRVAYYFSLRFVNDVCRRVRLSQCGPKVHNFKRVRGGGLGFDASQYMCYTSIGTGGTISSPMRVRQHRNAIPPALSVKTMVKIEMAPPTER